MATTNHSTLEQFPIPAALVEQILLGSADDRRVLQDSPILVDVWLAYAADPASIQDLLITPHSDATAAEVASCIAKGLKRIERRPDRQRGAKIAYLQGITAAQLYFDEVLRILVPLTQWWRQQKLDVRLDDEDPRAIRSRMHAFLVPARLRADPAQSSVVFEDFSAFERYIALAGLILWVADQKRPQDGLKPLEVEEVFKRYEFKIDEIVDAMLKLYRLIAADSKAPTTERKDEHDERHAYIKFH